MIPAHILKLKPFIVHGTDVMDVLSILKYGLWSKATLEKKKIKPDFAQTPFVQMQEGKLETTSVWVYDSTKEQWDNDKECVVEIANPQYTERVKIIQGEINLDYNSHVAYDFCFIIPPSFEIIKPNWWNFRYEALIREPGYITKDNCLAVVVDENKLLENAAHSAGIRWRSSVIKRVEHILKARGIPFIKSGWGSKVYSS